MVKVCFMYFVIPIYLIEEKYPNGIIGWLKRNEVSIKVGVEWFDEYLYVCTDMVGNYLDTIREELAKYDIVIKEGDQGLYMTEKNIGHDFSLKETKKKEISNDLLMKMKILTAHYDMHKCKMVSLEEINTKTPKDYFESIRLYEKQYKDIYIDLYKEEKHLSLWQKFLNLFNKD